MGLFSTILDKLGFDKEKTEAAEKAKPAQTKTAAEAAAERHARIERIKAARAQRSKEVPMVDVMAKLKTMADANPQKLNWKKSIVDLLKLLGIDSSFEARKELAVELGCPAELMDESAEMNTWLHKTVLEKIAENGGNIPLDLLD
jgi:hypothetical protein